MFQNCSGMEKFMIIKRGVGHVFLSEHFCLRVPKKIAWWTVDPCVSEFFWCGKKLG